MNAMPFWGRPKSGAVDVVDVGSTELHTWRGRIEAEPGDHLVLVLEAHAGPLSEGTAVVLDWRTAIHPRVVATVVLAEHPCYRLRMRRQVARDRRVFPRLAGAIALRYVRLPADEDAAAAGARWLAEGVVPEAAGAFEAAAPLMNFSVNGVRFHDDGRLAPGEHLLCEVGVHSEATRWRTVATVARRVSAEESDLPVADLEPPADQVALSFCDPPEGLIEALAAYTLALQRHSALAG